MLMPIPSPLPLRARLARLTTTACGLVCLALGAAGPAAAVLLATTTGTGNTTAPASDPGFGRVGRVNGLSGVYYRNGWVLTASHVGEGALTLGATTYPAVPGSTFRFPNGDGTLADLIAFKLVQRPPLADAILADSSPTMNLAVTMIGGGFDRGNATSWNGANGWQWLGSMSFRWGTNRIAATNELALGTRAFGLVFDDPASVPQGQYEADVVYGDSGGGVFTGGATNPKLIGILFARASFVGQPANTSLFGNQGLVVDLFTYRSDILALTGQPDCSDGLDEDADGAIDFPNDPGCTDAADSSERSAALACDDGIDEDGDALVDFPADPGCDSPADPSEHTIAYQCDNGVDDDSDLLIDYPTDPQCGAPTDLSEVPEPSVAAMLAGAIGWLGALGSRRARGAARATQTSSTTSTR